ncbi:type IV pilus modification PilV family protein [Thermosulfuriphilus sp.]
MKHGNLSVSGFSVLEILVAIAIFSIGILALANMNIVSLRGVKTSKDLTSATLASQSLLEEYVFSKDFEFLDTVCSDVPSSFSYGSITFSVQCRLVSYSDDLKQVWLILYWDNNRLQFSVFRVRGDT